MQHTGVDLFGIADQSDGTSLAKLQIPDHMKTTNSGTPFLIHDSGRNVPNRILIFASDEQLICLSHADRFVILIKLTF